MPLITSLTSVCAPKPIATPITPAPAISGPISYADRREGHQDRHDDDDDEQHVPHDRQKRAQA